MGQAGGLCQCQKEEEEEEERRWFGGSINCGNRARDWSRNACFDHARSLAEGEDVGAEAGSPFLR